MLHDVFICHTSEDKDEFVRPLAAVLRAHHVDVWYDESTLTIGDSLRQAIDRGLAESQFGIVVLSLAFFPEARAPARIKRPVSGGNHLTVGAARLGP